MRIYAINNTPELEEPIIYKAPITDPPVKNKVDNYLDWYKAVTEYNPQLIETKPYQGRTREEYLAHKDAVNEYCQKHFGQTVIDKVIELYRKLTPKNKISDILGIQQEYVATLLKLNMDENEYETLSKRIKAIGFRKYKYMIEQREKKTSLPEIVWKAFYIQKKSIIEIMKMTGESYEKIRGIVNAIKGSLQSANSEQQVA